MTASKAEGRPPAAAHSGEPPRSGRASIVDLMGVRDFRLLFAGRSVSLLGDGAFLVAMAWEAYTLSGSPAALSLLGVAISAPLIVLLIFGGVVSDRYERRHIMLLADVFRAVLLALLGALALTGKLELWEMAVLLVGYGSAQAFFDPSSDALLPQILPSSQLVSANALEQLMRPLALRMAGPAFGGILVGTTGTGAAFLLDAITFLISAVCLWRMSPGVLTAQPEDLESPSSVLREVREGFAFVRRHVWLWGTLASAGVAYLLFMGPVEVLLPFMVKHELSGSGLQLGLVMGAGGLGSIACAVCMLRGELPARNVVFMYVVWTCATLTVAGYGLATAIWQLMVASLAFNLFETAGIVVWATMKQRLVPSGLLGRVSSLDWLISIALLPLSFALTSPISALLGARDTLVIAGVAGAAVTFGALLLPGMLRSGGLTGQAAQAGVQA